MKMYVEMVVPFIAENADRVEYLNDNTVCFTVNGCVYYLMIYPEKVILACEGIQFVSEYFRENIAYFMEDIHDLLER